MTHLSIVEETFQLAETFAISRGARTEAKVLTVRLTDGTVTGVGECFPYARYNETHESVSAQIESIRSDLDQGLTTEELQHLLPAGAARNAVDCALWDLVAKQSGQSVWALNGLPEPQAVTSVYTLSLGAPDQMRQKAKEHAHRPLLKIKLGGEGDIDRLRAVREGAPASSIVVDANEGWTLESYHELAPVLLELGVEMVEQPFPAGEDEALLSMDRPLPVCADESCHDVATLQKLSGKYDMINIKLDKTGGLTEALKVREIARAMEFKIMVGCMVASSLAMAPALLVSQGVDLVDLDAPLLLAEDREWPMRFEGSEIQPSDPRLWG